MKPIACAIVAALALTAGAAAAGSMSNMQGMPKFSAGAVKHGQGTGVITAIDPKTGSLTIRHGPIPGVGWPAMTMTFKATPATLLKGLKVGETIGFDCTVRGMAADVTAVRPH